VSVGPPSAAPVGRPRRPQRDWRARPPAV